MWPFTVFFVKFRFSWKKCYLLNKWFINQSIKTYLYSSFRVEDATQSALQNSNRNEQKCIWKKKKPLRPLSPPLIRTITSLTMQLDLPRQVDKGKFPQKVIGPLPLSPAELMKKQKCRQPQVFLSCFFFSHMWPWINTSANLHLLWVPARRGLPRHFQTTFGVFCFVLFSVPTCYLPSLPVSGPSHILSQESMDALHRRLERSRQMQTVLKAFEARDRNLLEDNLWRVSFWSCASVLVMLCVALTQVHGGHRSTAE